MYLCAAQNQRGSARLLYVHAASMLLERTRLFFLGESFEFKRFKTISQEGGASDCRPSNTDRRRLFRSFSSPLPCVLSWSLFAASSRFFLSFFPAVTYCELLRELLPYPKKAVPFGTKNFGQHEKWRGRPAHSQYVSSGFIVTRVAGIASFVVCDNNFYDAHWLLGDRWRYYGQRREETPPRQARIRGGPFIKSLAWSASREEGIRHSTLQDGYECRADVFSAYLYIRNSVADFIACTRNRNVG